MCVKTMCVLPAVFFLACAWAGAESELDRDVRLSRLVTYSAARADASAIVADLSTKTGVTLRAGYNAGDWSVRESKLNVFAKAVPLRDLMNSVARVLKCKWGVGGKEDAPTYRLVADATVVLEGEAKLPPRSSSGPKAERTSLRTASALIRFRRMILRR